jgi:hypothetical protein
MFASIARLTQDMNDAKAVVGGAMAEINSAVEMAKKSLGALGIVASLGGLAALAESAITAAAEMYKLSERTGVAVNSLSGLRAAAKLSGTDMNDVATGLQKLSKSMVEAQSGTGKAADTFRALGVSATDGSGRLKSADAVMLELAKSLQQFQPGVATTTALINLFGKAGANLAPVLNELAEKGTLAGKVTTEQGKQAHEFERQMAQLKATTDGYVRTLVLDLLPFITKLPGLLKLAAEAAATFFAIFVAAPAIFVAAKVAFDAFALAVYEGETLMGIGAAALNTSIFTLGPTFKTMAATAGVAGTAILTTLGVLAAAFFSYKIGEWLHDNFMEAQLAGIAFVDGSLKGWEAIKYGAQLAWLYVKDSAKDAFQAIGGFFADIIDKIASGLGALGKNKVADTLAGYATSLREATKNSTPLAQDTAKLTAEYEKNKKAITEITDAMADEAIKHFTASDAGEKHKKTLKDLGKDTDALLKALRELAKAQAEFGAQIGHNATAAQMQELERLYKSGAIDVEEYYKRKAVLELADIDITEKGLVLELAAAQKAADGTKKLEDRYKAQAKVLEIEKQLVALGIQRMKVDGPDDKRIRDALDYADAEKKASDWVLQQWQTLQNGNEEEAIRQKYALDINGTYKTSVDLANLRYEREKDTLEIMLRQSNLGDPEKDGVRRQLELKHEQELTSAGLKEQLTLMGQIESAGKQLWDDLWQGGSDTFKRLGADLKKYFIDLLYQLVAKQWIVNIAASVTGGGGSGASGVAGSAISSLGGSALSSVATSAIGGIAGAFEMGASGAVAGGVGVGIGAGLEAGLAAIPVVGWIGLAALALYSIFGGKGGGPKTEAGYNPGGLDISGTDIGGGHPGGVRGDVASAKSISDALSSGLSGLGAQFGLTLKQEFGVFYAKDPQGDSQTQLQIVGSGGYNRSSIEGGIENVGRDDKDLQAAVDRAAAQIDLMALAKAMTGKIGDYLKALDPVALTTDQIKADIQLAANAKHLTDAFHALGPAFSNVADLSVQGLNDLATSMGGIEKASADLNSLYTNFYDAAQQRAIVVQSITDTLNAAGLNVSAGQVGSATRDQFLQLLDAELALGDAGAQAAQALLSVNGAFASIAVTTQKLAGSGLFSKSEIARMQATDIQGSLARSGLNFSVDQIMGASVSQVRQLYDALNKIGDSGAANAVLDVASAFVTMKENAGDFIEQQKVMLATGYANEKAYRQKAVDDAQAALTAAQGKLQTAFDAQVSALQPTIDALLQKADALRSARDALAMEGLFGTDRYNAAKVSLRGANPDNAAGLVTEYLKEASASSKTNLDYLRAVAEGRNVLKTQEAAAMTQANFYSAQINATRALLAPLLGADQKLQSIEDLMAAVVTAQANLAAAKGSFANLASDYSSTTGALTQTQIDQGTMFGVTGQELYVPPIQTFATGGYASGRALVGENGPEFVDFKTPGRVYPADQTAGMFGSGDAAEVLTRIEERLAKIESNTHNTDSNIQDIANGRAIVVTS